MRRSVLLIASTLLVVSGADIQVTAATGVVNATADGLTDGTDLMTRSNFHAAEVAFQHAVEANPNSPDAHAGLAYAIALQMHKGPVTSAENRPWLTRVLEQQQRAVELAPRKSLFVRRLAFMQEAMGRATDIPDERTRMRNLAMQNVRRALRLAPRDVNAYFQLAAMELFTANTGIWSARLAARDKSPDAPLNDPALKAGLAFAYRATLDEAITAAEKTVSLRPDHGFAMLLAALGYSLRASLSDSDQQALRDSQAAKDWQASFRQQSGSNYSDGSEGTILRALLNPQLAIATTGAAYGGPLGIANGALGDVPATSSGKR